MRIDPVDVRRADRERIMTLLYQAEITDQTIKQVLDKLELDESKFVTERLLGVANHLEQIDSAYSKYMEHWTIDRMPPIDRSLLRFAVYELIYADDVSAAVAISEAVELAKMYSTDDSGKFINGVLSAMVNASK